MKKRAEYYAYSKGEQFKHHSMKEIFSKIIENKKWIIDPDQESISGTGSSIIQTEEIIRRLPKILNSYHIKSVLDIPCGDFNWMRHIDWTRRTYIGGDILADVIENNNRNFHDEFITFKTLDLTANPLPFADLLFCRDCLVHLSYEDIQKALKNIKKSRATYLMTTTFPDEDINEDIITGGWRPINLCHSPFNFPESIELLNEHCTEADGLFSDKSLGLWEISSLPDIL